MNACRDLNELEPSTRYLANLLLQKCKEQGINIVITETYRSQERQNELYAQGRSKQGQIVTWTLDSKHKTRKAFDFVPITNGQANWNDLNLFKRVGDIGESIGLTWGGDWQTPDRPHFQYDGVAINVLLKKGSKGEQVKQLQQLLRIVADGNFGPATEKAVKQFQMGHGLVVDGVVGNMTWGVLNR